MNYGENEKKDVEKDKDSKKIGQENVRVIESIFEAADENAGYNIVGWLIGQKMSIMTSVNFLMIHVKDNVESFLFQKIDCLVKIVT